MSMKRALLLIIIPAFILVLFLPASSFACQYCQAAVTHELLDENSRSAHAAEFRRLARSGEAAASSPSSYLTPASASASAANAVSPRRGRLKQQETIPDIHAARNTAGKLPPTSYVEPGTKPDKKITIEMTEGETFLGNGVIYKGFLINDQIPGPTLIVDEGDVVEFTVVNKGSVPHGVSIHAAYTQTSKYLGQINPGETKSMLFRASYPGVYMYHCAPGGHAIPMHVLLGQYGMMVVNPKTHQYRMEEILGRKPDVEVYLVQHELYASGKDAIKGNAIYQMFNGKLFRLVEEPVVARPGDFVRMYFLNVGPNLISTFHLVGIIWDFAYWQGLPNPENTFVGGQSVLAGPTDSWIVDFRAPEDEGAYLIVNHAMGQTTRGSIGILSVSNDGERTPRVLSDGPRYTAEEMAKHRENAVRVISPTEPSPDELRNPWRLPAGETRAEVQIIGNSYYPKVIEVPVGTTVEWVNEDVFTYFQGEFSGVHNVVGYEGPEMFSSPMLGHAERFSYTFTKPGDYSYLCTPHPYMRGVVRVVER